MYHYCKIIWACTITLAFKLKIFDTKCRGLNTWGSYRHWNSVLLLKKHTPLIYQSPYLAHCTGATGQDLRLRNIKAVRKPLVWPICGALVLFLLLLAPHRCEPGWGPCSEHALLPLAANNLARSLSNFAANSCWTSRIVVVDMSNTSF